jgi:cytoskeleton protein RodZ
MVPMARIIRSNYLEIKELNMESLGERLKRGREEKNISLDDVVHATKINKGILTAIENDQSEFLPPMVFVRGFIRNYARYVGLNEKELLDLYNETCAGKKADTTSEELKVRKKRKFNALYIFLILVFVLAILLAYPYFLRNYFENKPSFAPQKKNISEKTKTPLVNQTNIPKNSVASLGVEASPVSGKTPALENPSSPAPLSADKKTVAPQPSTASYPAIPTSIQMKAKCYATTWIGYVIDNGQPSQIFLFPRDEFSWEWKDKLELKLGNAGGIKVTVNGVPLKPLGKSGEVLSVVFGKDTVAFRGEEPQKLDLWKEQVKSHTSRDMKRP